MASVKVICRYRSEQEGTDDGDRFSPWEFELENATVKLKDKSFTYDALLNECNQNEAYEKTGRETISQFMNGYNATIFAYGQSGSGKTYSMVGPDDINDKLSLDFSKIDENTQKLFGIIPRATIQMFQSINDMVAQGTECCIECSYVEIYMEEITCLLTLKEKLKIKEYPDGSVEVDGKKTIACKTPEDIFKVIAIGTKNKSTGGTLQNARSSRSHTLLVIEVKTKTLEGEEKKAKLNLIDLAGSEKTRNTGATGDRAKEAIKINLSLTSLNMVFMALTSPGENKYIPFKDSKLTRLLKDSLGGNSLTTLLCTASKKNKYAEDTLGTLGFAQRAKKIKNNVKQNVQMGVKEYMYLAEALKTEIMILRSDLKKSGQKYHLITDKKVLSYLPNDAIMNDAAAKEIASNENPQIGNTEIVIENEKKTDEVTDQSSKLSKTKGNMKIRKRASIVDLDETDLIMKYLEIKAKYDNLLSSAGEKIQELSNPSEIIEGKVNNKNEEIDKLLYESSQKFNETINEHRRIEEELSIKIDNLMKEKLILIEEKEKLAHDYDDANDMLNLNMVDINCLTDKISKKKNKKKTYKEEHKKLKAKLEEYESKVEELFKKVSEGEYANAVYNFKIQELTQNLNEVTETLNKNKSNDDQIEFKNTQLEEQLKELQISKENSSKIEEENNSLKNKLGELKKEIDNKSDQIIQLEQKINEYKAELSVLKAINEKNLKEYSELKQKYSKLESESKTIKSIVPIKMNPTYPSANTSNYSKPHPFAHLLKKNDCNFLKEAKEDAKKKNDELESIYGKNFEQFKKLRENIVSMTPKTISSRTPPDDLIELDFDDEEGFAKIQEKLKERDNKLQHEKDELIQKLQIEADRQKKEEEKGMVI